MEEAAVDVCDSVAAAAAAAVQHGSMDGGDGGGGNDMVGIAVGGCHRSFGDGEDREGYRRTVEGSLWRSL